MFGPRFSLTFLIVTGAILGLIPGILAGLLACFAMRLRIRLRDILADGLLGSVGLLAAFELLLLIPWQNTITYHEGSIEITSTSTHYQYPNAVSLAAAILLPVLREAYRFVRARRKVTVST